MAESELKIAMREVAEAEQRILEHARVVNDLRQRGSPDLAKAETLFYSMLETLRGLLARLRQLQNGHL